MVSQKEMRFQGKNKDLNQLSEQITQYLQNDGYKVQATIGSQGPVIQAQKAGILRDIITADRCFTIVISGQPNDFTVTIGIGKWVQNIAVAAAEALILSVLFLAVNVPEMLWTVHVENDIAKRITEIVAETRTAGVEPPVTAQVKYCSKCGAKNPVEAQFCGECGTTLTTK
jgi:hypothetical protein